MRQQATSQLYRPFRGDENLVVKFYIDDEKDEAKTLENGYAFYNDVEKVHITSPGEKLVDIHAYATSQCTMKDGSVVSYADRFPDDYDRFKAGMSTAHSGLHLKNAPFLSKAEVTMLNRQNFFTVEQLADSGGAPLRSLGPNGRKWQQQAAAFLQTAAGNRDALAQAAETAALKDRIAQLEAMVSGQPAPAASEPEDDEADEKKALKDEIEAVTGHRPRGNPSIASLKSALEAAKEGV